MPKCGYKWFISLLTSIPYHQDDVISLTSTSNTDTTSRSRSGTPTNKVTNGNKRGRRKSKPPKVVKSTFKFKWARTKWYNISELIVSQLHFYSFAEILWKKTMACRCLALNSITSWSQVNQWRLLLSVAIEYQFIIAWKMVDFDWFNAMLIRT